MVCEHVEQLEQELIAAGTRLTYRGQPWSSNCREWVYFACLLDRSALRGRLALPECVVDHDAKSGLESGLVCSQCHDAVVGVHPTQAAGYPSFG